MQVVVGWKRSADLQVSDDPGAQRLSQSQSRGPGGFVAADTAHQDERVFSGFEHCQRLGHQPFRRASGDGRH
jgi:hypothetical protein